MQLDPRKTQPSVDAKTAQEALALAIRLQQEKGERVSLEELQRTADEAGIDRVYLESALNQVSNKPVESTVEPVDRRRIIAMAGAAAIALITAIFLSAPHGGEPNPAFYAALAIVAIAVRGLVRGPRSRRRRRDRDWR